MDYILSIITFSLITIIAVSGVFALTGLTGLFSLGQAAFMALGAYISGLFVIKFNLPFAIAGIIAIVISTLVGFVVGIPTAKLRRDYISLVTLGFGEAIAAMLKQAASLTGGSMGLSGIPKKTTFLIAFISAVVVIIIIAGYKNSKYGRQAIALRSDELAAQAMGIDIAKIKLITFLLSVAIVSYAGVLYAFFTTYVEPDMFDWTQSAEWVIMVFFGGVNSLTGSIIAAILLTALPEALRFADAFRIILYSVLVIIIINFKPTGLFGENELSIKLVKRLFTGNERKVANGYTKN
ncbi:branched-chain amino acid ABC transporter permease [Thermoanaerobacterium thermosaccharolyticum]|uniref:branched-chain amino acid ABC transporter permease n=1 Tax=Thermoanaerobacterium thermosaccharolyticum TaxID=1517 RepID=UPI003DA80D4C